MRKIFFPLLIAIVVCSSAAICNSTSSPLEGLPIRMNEVAPQLSIPLPVTWKKVPRDKIEASPMRNRLHQEGVENLSLFSGAPVVDARLPMLTFFTVKTSEFDEAELNQQMERLYTSDSLIEGYEKSCLVNTKYMDKEKKLIFYDISVYYENGLVTRLVMAGQFFKSGFATMLGSCEAADNLSPFVFENAAVNSQLDDIIRYK